jgi:transposase
MARPYSVDLRERVIAAASGGESCRRVAKRFAVSVSSVVKWSQRARATGSPAAAPMGGRRPFALAGERDFVLARLREKPDLTLRGLAAELEARGVRVSVTAVWSFCAHEGLTFKKKPARQRARSPGRREAA